MTPKAAERWRRQRARDVGINGRLTRTQRDLLRMIQHHHEMAARATTDSERSSVMMREAKLIGLLCSYKVSRAKSLRW